MTTNMNFGPEWMRGSLPKYSSNQSSEILDSLLPSFEDQHQQQLHQENPFKYSKDFMLSLYKPDLQLPVDFNQHEYVTTDKILAPLATEELTEFEKKLLSGPVHSEASSRKSNAARHRSDLYSASPLQSPASENGPTTPGGNRLGQRKVRTGDYFGKDQPLKRGDGDVLKRRDQVDDLNLGKLDDEGTNWTGKGGFSAFGGSNNNTTATAASNSNNLFGDNDTFKSSTEALFGSTSDLGGLSNIKKPESTKWYYRDPSGQVQGPFEAQEMQDWYKAGFFTPTLMLRREDETIFEPLMLLTQKVGTEDTPFLAPRPRLPVSSVNTPGVDLFGGASERLFGNDKYMPFGGAPTTPGGSFSNNAPTSPLYQSPYYGNPLIRDNRWDQQPQASPSWLSSNPTSELFGGPASPFAQQPPQSLNHMFAGGMNSPSLFDYHQRPVTDQIDQHQQYMNMLQQNQQQRSMQFQQQTQTQQQFQPTMPIQQQQQQQLQNQEPSPQNAFKNLTLDNVSNHASPVMKSNILATSGWGSPAPGTPIGEVATSPWGSIVSTAIPTKVSEELQAKAPGAQSPRAPSSPKKAIEKPAKVKSVVESFADIQLEEQKKAAAAASVAASAAVAATPVVTAPAPVPAPTVKEEPVAPKVVSTPAPIIAKPVVSLREIQQEELRIAKEKKAKQAKAIATTPTWAASNNTPLHTTTTTWSQPTQKPLSLREIQEMEAKEQQQQQQKSAAEYLSHQEKLANSTPSTLSWGVVVPNSKSAAPVSSTTSSSSSAAWTAPAGPKKTLREIQQEEELAMKKKNAKANKNNSTTAAAIAAANASTPASRAYAVTPSAGGAWTTVTNTRTPKAAAVIPPPTTTTTTVTPVVREPVVKPAAPKVRSGPSEDFRRWCKKALRDLNSGVNQEEIVDMLVSFPVDANASEIIEDVIYANSLRIDGKRFAQEFMKRRKADIAGRLDIVTAGLEDEDEDDFKVVIKKGKKKAL